MKTSLFNLHEIKINGGSVIIEFYAGDIFDIHSDILLLSAYKGQFFPTPGTTWGSLFIKTGMSVVGFSNNNSQRLSDNILLFQTTKNSCFNKLFALELSDLNKKSSFTNAALISRYRELIHFLENYPSETEESISLPLLGTGNQGLSLEDSVAELLKTFNQLKKTKLKIIRVFAKDFASIGVLNKKINEVLKRKELTHKGLLLAAIDESQKIITNPVSPLTFTTITNLLSLANSDHSALNIFGLVGRIFAESVCAEFLQIYRIDIEPSVLSSKISALSINFRQDRPHIEPHLRLLQIYGNQVSHAGNPDLNHQDATSIVISIMRIADFYEFKFSSSTKQI